MAMNPTTQDNHTNLASILLGKWINALTDNHIDDTEQAELTALILQNYGFEELKRAAEMLVNQINRHPDTAPNRPLCEHLDDLVRVCSDLDAKVKPLVRELEMRKAA